jgi:hypothetical protein
MIGKGLERDDRGVIEEIPRNFHGGSEINYEKYQ